MTDVGEFIDDILQHEYDPVKAREYYLRTRKLKGRATKKVKQLADKAWETDKEYNAKVNKAAGALVRDRAKARAAAKAARQERLLMQQRRLDQAKAKAKKIKDEKKRRSVEGKLNALQGRLTKALLPSGKIKVSRGKTKKFNELKAPSFRNVRISRKNAAPKKTSTSKQTDDNLSGRTDAARRRASNLDDNMSLRPRTNRGRPSIPKQGNDNLSLRPRPARRLRPNL